MSEGLVAGEGFAIDASVIKADANRARGVPGTEVIDWNKGEGPSRAVREYLQALEENNPTSEDADELVEPPTVPKNVSLTDPASRWTAAPGGPAFYAYSTNYLIDLQAGIIVDVEATPANRTQEVDSTRTMLDRVEQRFRLKPRRLSATPLTAPDRCWAGWSRTSASSRTCRSGRGASAGTARYRAATSSGMSRQTNIVARKDTRC
jgi:hypothetical protein